MSDFCSNVGAARRQAVSPQQARIPQSDRAAILVEQLSYLLNHSSSCPKNCPDCARLRYVEEMLMRPFRVNIYKPA